MLKIMGKKIFTICAEFFCLSKPVQQLYEGCPSKSWAFAIIRDRVPVIL